MMMPHSVVRDAPIQVCTVVVMLEVSIYLFQKQVLPGGSELWKVSAFLPGCFMWLDHSTLSLSSSITPITDQYSSSHYERPWHPEVLRIAHTPSIPAGVVGPAPPQPLIGHTICTLPHYPSLLSHPPSHTPLDLVCPPPP